jgi:hypothetical protein
MSLCFVTAMTRTPPASATSPMSSLNRGKAPTARPSNLGRRTCAPAA